MSPQQSSGTVLGYLNVTDPDNEIFHTKSQQNYEKKQQLRITIDSEHEDLLPFKIADGYLVKYGVSMGIRKIPWLNYIVCQWILETLRYLVDQNNGKK